MQIDRPSDRAGPDGRGTDPLVGVVERVLFERPETGYRVLLVAPAGGSRAVVVVRCPAGGRPRGADPRRGRLVRRPELGPPVPRDPGHARGPCHRGRTRRLPGLGAHQGRRRGAGQAPRRPVRRAARRGDRARAPAPARRRGGRPAPRGTPAGGVAGATACTRHAPVPGGARFQLRACQPHRRGLRDRGDPDHPQGPLRTRPRHPRHRLRHRRPGRAAPGRRTRFRAADRRRAGRGPAPGRRQRRHRAAARGGRGRARLGFWLRRPSR